MDSGRWKGTERAVEHTVAKPLTEIAAHGTAVGYVGETAAGGDQ